MIKREHIRVGVELIHKNTPIFVCRIIALDEPIELDRKCVRLEIVVASPYSMPVGYQYWIAMSSLHAFFAVRDPRLLLPNEESKDIYDKLFSEPE
jgi:hypothetical protein